MAETNYVLQVYNGNQFRLIHTYDGGENTYSLPPSETQVDGSVVLSGYLVTSLPCAVVSSGWGVGYRLQDVESALADGSINVSSGKCVISDSNGTFLYDLNNRGVVRGLHNPAYACNNGEILTLAYSLVDPSAPTVINLHYNIPRAEKVYDGYPFRCNQSGFFDDNVGFPSVVEVYDDNDVFRGYSHHYHYIHGHIDVNNGEWIQDEDCSTIGKDVGVYDFIHSVSYDVEENREYFTESELEDLDNIEFNYVRTAPFSAEIKPRKISFEMSDIELQDKVYDGEPIHYNESDVSVIVGGDGFAVYEDEDGNIITEGADVKIRFNETPEFTKNVLEDNEKYYLTYSIYVEDLVPWENTNLWINYDFTKLIYTKQKSAHITPKQLTPSNAYDISNVYDCSNKVFLTADDFTLNGLVHGDENRVQFIVNTQTDDGDVIREIGTHNVTYHYSLGGVGARNYTLSRTSDTATVTITESSILLDTPIVDILGDEMWENGSLFSTYDSETQKITVRAYMSASSTHIPQYVRVLAGSANYGTVSVYNQIPTYSFDGEAYNSINTQTGHISIKAIYNTTNIQKRKGNFIYWEVEFDVCEDSSIVTQAFYDNKWHPNITYNVFVWGFDEGCNTSNINYETFRKLKTETLPPNIGDIAVFLVDTPATPENEHQCGDSWYSEDTPHTLVNAIYFAMDNATILFSGSLMNNQQDKPIVSTEIEYGLYYAVTIDASKPYKIIKNENNEDEIVVDDSVANWSGVVVEYDEEGRTFSNVLFSIDTDTNNAVTLKNIYFKNGGCGIETMTPTYIYDCVFDGFIHRPITTMSDFKISRCIVKNCTRNLMLRGTGIVDDCLFINNNKIFNTKSHNVKIYNCTIIAPTDDFVDSKTPYKSDENSTGLTTYDFFNCFISGYPITYYYTDPINEEHHFYNRIARNNIILHTNSKPTLDSSVINEDGEDITEDCIRTYNEVFGADNIFNNEVYELSGINDNPTTNDFLYSNYRPRLKSSYTVVDKGNNSYIQSETDLGGNPRVWQDGEDTQGIVDIGCYEHKPYSTFPSIHLSAMEIIDVENSNTKIYHNEHIYNGLQNNVFDVVGDDDIVVYIDDITVYVLPDDYDFDNDGFNWDGVLDLEEVADYYSELAQETYTNIPTAKHNTAIPTNEEYKWGEIRNVMVLIPGYKACYGGVYITITPKTLELFDFSTTFSTE